MTEINEYLNNLDETKDSLTIKIEDYLTPGYSYESQVWLSCFATSDNNNNDDIIEYEYEYESVYASHLLAYDYSSLVCKI